MVSSLRTRAQQAWTYVVRLPRLYSIGGAVVLLLIIIVIVHFATKAAAVPATQSETPHVTLRSAGDLSSTAGPLALTGKVSSLNQSIILAQKSGELVSISARIGDHVGAGQVIGQFENSSEQAAVQQARGGYDAAVAARGASTLPDAEAGARDAYAAAYAATSNALQSDIDLSFGAMTPTGPALRFASADSQDFSRRRDALDTTMAAWRNHLADAATADPQELLTEAYADVQAVSAFATDLSVAANKQNAGATSAQLAGIATAQSSLATALSSLTAARSAYQSKSIGATSSADASVAQAQGALAAANAALAKTVVRSPISGTIVSLPVNQGDFVAAFSEVAEVSNPSALEISLQMTPDDAKTIAVGGKAVIDGSVNGTVAQIAPALDPTTGRIPVKVDFTDDAALVDGDTVAVSIERATGAATAAPSVNAPLTIPIVATKITPDGPIVFAVDGTALKAVSITLGAILGDRITVTSGLTSDQQIVTDARGLADGETVIVDAP